MIKALLIGCGNIGAGYDLADDKKVWTHAKGYAKTDGIALTVFDVEKVKAKQVADHYNADYLEDLNDSSFNLFDIISITTPTTSHFHYLNKALAANTPVIICEKPVVGSSKEANLLDQLYQSSTSKVLVNYIRRFQPAFRATKEKLLLLRQRQKLKAVLVKYKRGFLNNASHAIDLIEYLFNEPFYFSKFTYSSVEFDAFDYDPTITATCVFQNIPVTFAGIPECSFAVFELELFFSSSKVVICHSGNEVRYYHDVKGALEENKQERQTSILDYYMLPVINEAIACLRDSQKQDNFQTSLRLNNEILEIIESIKNKAECHN